MASAFPAAGRYLVSMKDRGQPRMDVYERMSMNV